MTDFILDREYETPNSAEDALAYILQFVEDENMTGDQLAGAIKGVINDYETGTGTESGDPLVQAYGTPLDEDE
jgi:hypothetical protein